MPKISVSIIAHNEEENIAACLESVKWADEIILVDCESSDKTVDIASGYQVKLFSRPNNSNLNINKSFGISQATGDVILYLDPDERVTENLKEEILLLSNGLFRGDYDAVRIPRRNYFLGRPLKYGGQYPDHQIRLFKKDKAYFPCLHVHEKPVVPGRTVKAVNCLNHYPYKNMGQFISKLSFYTDFQAEYLLSTEKKRPSALGLFMRIFLKPGLRFLRRYFLRLGFLDGREGYLAAVSDFYSQAVSWQKYLELLEENTKNTSPSVGEAGRGVLTVEKNK